MPLFLSFSNSVSSLSKATNIIKDFLKEKSVTRFRPYDVQDLLQPLICSQPQTASADQVRQNNNVKPPFWRCAERGDEKEMSHSISHVLLRWNGWKILTNLSFKLSFFNPNLFKHSQIIFAWTRQANSALLNDLFWSERVTGKVKKRVHHTETSYLHKIKRCVFLSSASLDCLAFCCAV